MTSLSFAAIVQASIVLTGTDGYAEAHQSLTQTGRPMVVMIGATWCPACQVMEKTVLPQVRKRGLLRRVGFAVVDLDQQRDLGQQLTAGGPIPQLVMYRKTLTGWKTQRMVGWQSVEKVENFINEGLAQDGEARKAEGAKVPPTPSDSPASQGVPTETQPSKTPG